MNIQDKALGTPDIRRRRFICIETEPEYRDGKFCRGIDEVLANERVASIRLSLVDGSREDMRKAAEFLLKATNGLEVSVILSEHFKTAADLGLDGVHLCGETGRVRRIREELGNDFTIGAFCGTSRHEALRAGEFGADYVSFGPAAATRGKDAQTTIPEIYEWWREVTVLPCMAEGGIDVRNACRLSRLTDYVLLDYRSLWGRNPARTIERIADS